MAFVEVAGSGRNPEQPEQELSPDRRRDGAADLPRSARPYFFQIRGHNGPACETLPTIRSQRVHHTDSTVELAVREIFGVQHWRSGRLGGVNDERIPEGDLKSWSTCVLTTPVRVRHSSSTGAFARSCFAPAALSCAYMELATSSKLLTLWSASTDNECPTTTKQTSTPRLRRPRQPGGLWQNLRG